jgi:ribose transport system ATP-binding protein
LGEGRDEFRVLMRGIKKSFAGVRALKGVDFSLKKGEIHALVGENGAGKSTLMKVLSGAYDCDEGEIFIDGAPVRIATPRRGKELGVGIVYQDFELAEDLSIAENIFMDNLGAHGVVRWGKLFADASRLLSSLGFDMDVRDLVKDVSVAYKQMVEIAKALSSNARILVLDEPTAVLTPKEADKLFSAMRTLKESGVSVVYISHRMDEVFAVADSITTMRDGEVTGGGPLSDFDVDRVVELMIGRKLSAMYPERRVSPGDESLRVEGLTGDVFRNVSFTLRKGEILGLFGLVGSGRSEIARAIFGEDRARGGRVYIDGAEARIHSPYQGRRHGIALIPEDRKEQGLVLDMSIKNNMTMTNMGKICGAFGFIGGRREDAVAGDLVKRLSVKTENAENRVDSLSGGNQQKVVFAKWLNTDSEIIIMDEPTRGVDVGAKVEIYNIMNELAAKGVAILMISSELNEIIGMCDRTLVIDNGEIKGELSRSEISEAKAMKLVVGGV